MSVINSDNKTKQLVSTALMMALILVGTILIRIPIPMTQGYVHIGDAMIYLGVLLFGRRNGTIAAGLGSAMGDVLGGFAVWAPWTFVIKALMAYISGVLIEKTKTPKVLAMTAGGAVMVLGYFVAEGIMYGNWPAAALGIPWNIGQFVAGIVLALILSPLLKKVAKK